VPAERAPPCHDDLDVHLGIVSPGERGVNALKRNDCGCLPVELHPRRTRNRLSISHIALCDGSSYYWDDAISRKRHGLLLATAPPVMRCAPR
jgi:hypothetical protein